jgi:hypothetical protein
LKETLSSSADVISIKA